MRWICGNKRTHWVVGTIGKIYCRQLQHESNDSFLGKQGSYPRIHFRKFVKYRVHSPHGPIIGCFSVWYSVPEARLPGGEPMVLRTTLHRNAPAILNNESDNRNISFLYLVTSLITYPDIKYGIDK